MIRDFDIHRIQQCGDEKTFPIRFTLKGIIADKDKISLDGFLDVTEDINEPIEVSFSSSFCKFIKMPF